MKGIMVYYGDGVDAVKQLNCDTVVRTMAVAPVPGVTNIVSGTYTLNLVDALPDLTKSVADLATVAGQGVKGIIIGHEIGANNPKCVPWFTVLGAEARRLGMEPIVIVANDLGASNARTAGCSIMAEVLDMREIPFGQYLSTKDAVAQAMKWLGGTIGTMDSLLVYPVLQKAPNCTSPWESSTPSPAHFAQTLAAVKATKMSVTFWQWGAAVNLNDPSDAIAAHMGPANGEQVAGF
jgi:hypothetical protein